MMEPVDKDKANGDGDGNGGAPLSRLQRRPRGPVAALLGHRLISIDLAEGTIEAEFQAAAHLFNPMGVMQGGMTMAMLEHALVDAVAAGNASAKDIILLEVQCNFLTAVEPGPVRCRARLVRQGRSTAFVEAQLFDNNGELAATASAVANLEEPEPNQP